MLSGVSAAAVMYDQCACARNSGKVTPAGADPADDSGGGGGLVDVFKTLGSAMKSICALVPVDGFRSATEGPLRLRRVLTVTTSRF